LCEEVRSVVMKTAALLSGGMQLEAGLGYQLVFHFSCFSIATRDKSRISVSKQTKTLSSLQIVDCNLSLHTV
jgi:hypothetical protein